MIWIKFGIIALAFVIAIFSTANIYNKLDKNELLYNKLVPYICLILIAGSLMVVGSFFELMLP
jgi:hypothetical protein